MLRRHAAVALGAAGVLALAAAAVAQPNAVEDRFTFAPVNASQAGPTGEGRFEIVINRWSPDEERGRVLSTLSNGEPERLGREIASGWHAGYIRLPGNVEYTLRYAHRVSRSDGGADVVLATDRPIWFWWDPAAPKGSADRPFTVIQLRLDPKGTGVGKLSLNAGITADKEAGTIALQDFANQPTLLTDVRRETT
jgi:hypothetical protein